MNGEFTLLHQKIKDQGKMMTTETKEEIETEEKEVHSIIFYKNKYQYHTLTIFADRSERRRDRSERSFRSDRSDRSDRTPRFSDEPSTPKYRGKDLSR
jgi:hypothetical protein